MQHARSSTAQAPKPQAHHITAYDRAVTHVRRHGTTDVQSLAHALGISEWHAQSLAKRMYEAGVVSSLDLFGTLRYAGARHD